MWPQVQIKVFKLHFTFSSLNFTLDYLVFIFAYFNFRCHGPRPPPNPVFTLKPKKKKFNLPSEVTPGTPCPPCPELVWRPCVGQHVGAERMVSFISVQLYKCFVQISMVVTNSLHLFLLLDGVFG